jgi:protein involved in polysaccharide export with SLBB domain
MTSANRTSTRKLTASVLGAALISFGVLHSTMAGAQALVANPGMLVSRAELVAMAARADSLRINGSESTRAHNAMLAAAIRQRLRDGDFQVGDRVIVRMVVETMRTDTAVVRTGKVIELPDKIIVPVAGVLRSELRDRVATEILKLFKARDIEVVPLVRLAVLGEVNKPGYFAFASDLPLTDAIMGAGGPTGAADLKRSLVRRGSDPYRSTDETRGAIAGGLTLDQFGLAAGDELVVGRRRDFGVGNVIGIVGALGSVVAVFVALKR